LALESQVVGKELEKCQRKEKSEMAWIIFGRSGDRWKGLGVSGELSGGGIIMWQWRGSAIFRWVNVVKPRQKRPFVRLMI